MDKVLSLVKGKWKLWEVKCKKCGGVILRVKKRKNATCYDCKVKDKRIYGKKYKQKIHKS